MIFDPIEDYLPGVMVHQYSALKSSILDCLKGKDTIKDKREGLKDKFHKNCDFNSTSRLLDIIFSDELTAPQSDIL